MAFRRVFTILGCGSSPGVPTMARRLVVLVKILAQVPVKADYGMLSRPS